MAIETVDLPINSMVIFHSYVTVYQGVFHNMWSFLSGNRIQSVGSRWE